MTRALILRNTVVAAVAFGLAVIGDFVSIHHDTADVEFFVGIGSYAVFYFLLPAAFWWANSPRLVKTGRGRLQNLGLCIALTVAWHVLVLIPLFAVHSAMGGRE